MASVNNMQFVQIASILNDVREQVTGQAAAAPVNEYEFVSVGNTVLKAGFDPVLGAITQVLARTIFSNRPYQRRFAGIRKDAQEWGAITRKLAVSDKDFENDVRFDLIDGASVDMFKVNKPIILQLNFYGQTVYEKSITIFRDQLNSAFQSSAQFGQFMAMIMQNVYDMLTQAEETLARLTIANFALGKIAANNGVVHLLTEYNAQTGASLTATTVYAPENFPAFIKWMYARVETLSEMMTERTGLYQIQVTDKEIMRHTPKDKQNLMLLTPFLKEMEARVLADTFNASMIEYKSVESVNFWQAAQSPESMQGTPAYLGTDGDIIEADDPITNNKVVGLIFDDEAIGYTVTDEWAAPTPFNAKGGYTNQFWHNTKKWYNDFTEKGIILCLD